MLEMPLIYVPSETTADILRLQIRYPLQNQIEMQADTYPL